MNLYLGEFTSFSYTAKIPKEHHYFTEQPNLESAIEDVKRSARCYVGGTTEPVVRLAPPEETEFFDKYFRKGRK